MCQDGVRPLNFETLLTDPLVRMMMAADGVTARDLVAPLLTAREAIATRELQALSCALAVPAATSGPV
ncbi:MAG: hypothetical protein M0Z28_02565 [Rhodospirillales bacterium]|nr:hypothetical protein [Rhodospirillales bacterium]